MDFSIAKSSVSSGIERFVNLHPRLFAPPHIALWAEKNPALITQITQLPPPPDRVAAWWSALDGGAPGTLSAAQRALATGLPHVIGNLEGVSYTARDLANRAVLEELRVAAHNGQAGDDVHRLAIAAVVAVLEKQVIGSPPLQLISLDLSKSPKAAICCGNLDTAENVTYLVAGMRSSVRNIARWIGAANNLFEQQQALSTRSLATVAWLGYQAPGENIFVLLGGLAHLGAARLSSALAGFGASRSSNPPYLAVVAHSYGTTMASLALRRSPVDSFTMLGSAGVEHSITGVQDLAADRVYVSQAVADVMATEGRRLSGRRDPREASFGATVFSAETTPCEPNGTRPGVTVHDANIHSAREPLNWGYLDALTESLYNTALASTGNGDSIAAVLATVAARVH